MKRRVAIVAPLAACAVLALGACSESRARRLSTQADALAHQSKYEQAIGLLEQVERDYPATDAARGAHERIVVWRGLMESGLKQDRRRAKDDLTAIGRGLLHYYEARHRYPPTLGDLAAAGQTVPEVDPWGRTYLYSVSEAGSAYRLECLGADGARGGEGDDVDLRVVNGNFVQDLPYEDR